MSLNWERKGGGLSYLWRWNMTHSKNVSASKFMRFSKEVNIPDISKEYNVFFLMSI